MQIAQRAYRGFLSLSLSGLLLGAMSSGHAEQVAVSPQIPEAYQSFVITIFVPCGSDSLDPSSVDINLSNNTITVDSISADYPECPLNPKLANIMGLPAGTYSVERKHQGNDFVDQSYGSLTVSAAPPTQPAFAFYNEGIKHYFITASTAEKNSLLGGGGGGGWAIVDNGFNAWPADGPAPAAAKPVCRFYSAAVNSHFYTAGAGECEMLKQPSSGWTYEGITFRALVPTKGSCYPGTTPVWRLYNDRFAQSDSNHRFVSSEDTYRHMIANGWVGEGVAFCSPES